ncbi:MAG: hypothetical protein ACFFA3_17885 [Promethearchaeota archaeon]
MNDYYIFYKDLNENDNLKGIKDELVYQKARNLNDIFIFFLHKEIKYQIIENLPLFSERLVVFL